VSRSPDILVLGGSDFSDSCNRQSCGLKKCCHAAVLFPTTKIERLCLRSIHFSPKPGQISSTFVSAMSQKVTGALRSVTTYSGPSHGQKGLRGGPHSGTPALTSNGRYWRPYGPPGAAADAEVTTTSLRRSLAIAEAPLVCLVDGSRWLGMWVMNWAFRGEKRW